MKKLLTFFLTALLAFTVGWAETATFTVNTYSTGTLTGAPSGVTTSVSTDASQMGNGGSQLTSGKHFTLTLSGFTSDYKVTGITLNYCTNASAGTGKFTATLGSNELGSYNITKVSSNGRTPRDAVLSFDETPFDGSDLVLNVTASANSVYVIQFTITYSENGGTPPVPDNWYRKVTSTNDLVEGETCIFVYENGSSSAGMGALNSNNYGTPISGLTIENNKVNIGGTDVVEFTLGTASGSWTFKNPDNRYLGTQSSSSDKFSTSASLGSYADLRWTINANGTVSNNSSSRYIRYGSSAFGLYTSGTFAYIYVKDNGACADPVFSPNGGVFTGSAEVTITSETEGATIYYTTDGTDPVVSRSSIANGGTVELTESCTLKAMAVKSGMENSAIVTSQSYTINPAGGGGSGPFTLVTDATTLEDGDEIIFVSSGDVGSAEAMSTTQNTNNRGVTAVTVSSSKTVSATDETQIFTLQGGTGAWYFYTGSGYIYAASSSGNQLKTETVADNNAKAAISISSNGEATVVFQGDYTRNHLRYNSSNNPHIYSCYAETSTQAKPFIYRRSISSDEPSLHATPNPLNINDTNEAGKRTGSIYVSGQNLNTDNVGITFDNSHSTNFSSNPGYFTQGGSFTDQQVDITYTGYALSATGLVRAANNQTNTTVNVNYLYTGPIYVVGNVNDKNWQTVDGVQMTRNESTGQYSVIVNAYNNGDGNAYLFFTKSIVGNSYDDLGDNRFGPRCNDQNGQPQYGQTWGYNSGLEGTYCDLDTVYKLNTISMAPGNYKITIDPAINKFMIEPFVVNVTISPEDGTHFTGPSISGTITSEPADATIEWSTDGTNWQSYTDGFTATVNNVGGTVTVYARATSNGVTSDVAQATYTRDTAPAPAAPSFSMGSSAVAAGTVITITAPEGCTLYVNGEQVTSPYDVTINEATTITAYCENDEGTQSATVTNSYTIAAVCNAIIEFKDSDSDSSSATSWNAIGGTGNNDYFEAGKDYLDGASDITRVYKGKTGLKYGNSSNGGTITFSLDDETEWKVSHITLNAKNYNDNNVTFTVSTDNGQSQTTSAIGSTLGGYTLDFDGSAITSITISATARAYLKGFTITYDCAPEVEAPVITPATGTYYESQSVTMTSETDGTTIYYTTDGSEPTTSSTVYNDEFTAPYTAGSTTTINAIAVDGQGNISPVTTVVYTWGVPTVTIIPDSRNTTASSVNVTLTGTPADATIYYTTDGSTPTTSSTVYNGPFSVELNEIGDQVTVNAIAVYNGLTSDVASATYTRVEKLVDVNAPFFSPLQNHTYYGNQTLEIGCTTPNADIYYEIVEVSGTTAPGTGNVNTPTKSSTYYDGSTINMTVGNSYYVKAIAYIGDYVSTVSEGWYTIEAAPTTQYTYTNLKDFNDNCPTNVTAHFLNPVQVVYHSTYTNNGEYAEFCYLRDNTDYACVYFGKRDNSNKTIFKMGDWIDGSQIAGVTNIWDRNFHIQLGTQSHEVTSWPTTILGWSEIIPEEMTNNVIVAGTSDGDNVWGHYVHLRNATLSNVDDYSDSDPKHTGMINDGTADAYYYDKFYRWSAGTCTYTSGGNTYTDQIQCLDDYDQAFFDAKQNAGATFDVYGIVDYYSQYNPPFEMCPIDFLWTYKPVMTPATTTSFEPVTVNITATQPEWAAEGVVIYYKTDDMEEWAVYTEPITVNSTTTIQAYAEVPSEKLDGTNYNDYVRSEIVTETYTIEGIEDPTISPASQVIEIVTGEESVHVTVTDHNEEGSGAVTTYTVNGVEYTLEAGQSAEFDVTETTTVAAVSSIVSGENTLYSNEVSETYTFVKKNGVIFDLLKTAPVVGNVYVIVNKDAYMGMSTTQNENNRGSVGVMFTDDTKERVYGNNELAQFVLEQANAGRYYFKNINGDNTGYLVVTTNAAANLNTATEANSYAEAGVSVENGNGYPATITFYYDGTPRYLRYYENGRTFSTYADGSLNKEVYLYGLEATPLAYIEATPSLLSKQVTVSDQLIGTWSVINTEKGIKQLWAKDQGNLSIDKRPAKTDGQTDYMRDILKYQNNVWDESNWVILDFSNVTMSPEEFVGHKITAASVVGTYSDNVNYTITLTQNPILVSEGTMDVPSYPGYQSGYLTENAGHLGSDYALAYNTYCPANFMDYNQNRLEGDKVVGPVGGDNAVGVAKGDSIYFMNPKIQEVVRLWAVWCGAGSDRFAVYATDGQTVNAWDIDGAVRVINWDYNLKQSGQYGPAELVENQAYEFHAVISRLTGNKLNASASESQPSGEYGIAPLDLPDGGNPTAVKEMLGTKEVESVRYYNVMGVESDKPFEGINIVVTRFTDGTTMTMKVLK